MISLKEFIEKTKGTKVDVPFGSAHPTRLIGQCVSLIQAYIEECLGQTAKARGNAIDWDETYVKEGLGTITKTPRYGDIIVFNPPYAGKFGHIAIYIDKNTMYDQNNGTHDNRCAGYGKLLSGGVYIRPNATLIPDEKDIYTKGYYKLNYNMYIRKTPNGEICKVKECTQAMRSALMSKELNDKAVIKKGTTITALDIVQYGKSIWLKNYSGYVCVKGTKEYCKKVN